MANDERASGEYRIRLRPRTFIPLIFFLALIVHLLLPRLAMLDQSVVVVLRSMSPVAIAIAVCAQALSYLANGAVLRSIVASSGERLSLGRTTAIVMAASTICLVAGGIVGYGAAVYQWSRNSGTSRQTSAVAAWLPSVFDTAALIVFALLSAAALLEQGRLSPSVTTGLLVIMSLLVGIVAASFYALARSQKFVTFLRWLRKAGPVRRRISEADVERIPARLMKISTALRARRGLEAAAAALLNLTFDMATLALVFIAAGNPIPLLTLVAGYGVPILLGRSSFLPGGIAVVEIGMTALYVGLGVPSHVAIVVVLTYRLISFWIPTLAGIPVAAVLQVRQS